VKYPAVYSKADRRRVRRLARDLARVADDIEPFAETDAERRMVAFLMNYADVMANQASES
jgi:hypothetical protein